MFIKEIAGRTNRVNSFQPELHYSPVPRGSFLEFPLPLRERVRERGPVFSLCA